MASISAESNVSTATSLIRLLYAARGLRGFGDGFAIIILPAYMTLLGYDAVAVGIVATASLLGTALLTLIVAGSRRATTAGAADVRRGLMAATGVAFPSVEHFA